MKKYFKLKNEVKALAFYKIIMMSQNIEKLRKTLLLVFINYKNINKEKKS